MRILIVDFAATSGGALSVLKDFYNEIKDDKKNEYIFLTSDYFFEETENIKVINLNKYKSWLKRLQFDYFNGKKYVKKYKPDLIFSLQNTIIRGVNNKQILYVHQSIPFQNTKKFSFFKKTEFKLAIIQHFIGSQIKKSIKLADRIIVQSEWMKESIKRVCKIDEIKINVINPVMNFDIKFNNNNNNYNNFFYPTSNEIYKNNEIIYQASELLNKKKINNFNVELTIDGKSNKNINKIGRIKREEVLKKYTDSILIFPSYIESFGMPLLEAMMSNSIILASNTSFANEILADYENAYFFNPFDANELSILMEKCINKEIIKKNVSKKIFPSNNIKIFDILLEKKYLFLGCLFNPENEKQILNNSKCGIQNATNNFQINFINGLIKNKVNFDICNVLPVGTYPNCYKKIYLKTKKWKYKNINCTEIGSINIHFLKQYIRYKKIKEFIKKNKYDTIIIYSTYLPFLKATYQNDIKKALIVPDLPEYYDYAKTSSLKKILRIINNKRIYTYINKIDYFCLLTNHMTNKLPINNKPYTVIEGISNNSLKFSNISSKDTNKRILLYSGTLNYKFGIIDLLSAFNSIPNSNYELWICGSGDAEKEIKSYTTKDKRIKFYGCLTKKEVNDLQTQATILINPRKNDSEYTKYSFPSKTIEYMQSGRPVIMYKLDGIPNEYDDYLYYVNDNVKESLKNTIINVCSKNIEELQEFGKKAKDWILEEKNSTKQIKKILDLINENRR